MSIFFRLALILLLGGIGFISYAQFEVPPAPNGYVLDQANIFSDETEQKLNTLSAGLQSETSTQIATVTLDSLQGYTIETASLEIARSWGVGQDEYNNGILVTIAPNEREVRIEVGYGMEGVVTDAEASWIIRNLMIPSMREQDYDTAILFAYERLIALAKHEVFPTTDAPTSTSQKIIFFIWVIIVFGGLIISVLSGTRSWWLGGVMGGIAGAIASWWSGAIIGVVLGLIIDYILSKYFYKKWNIVDSNGRNRWTGGGGGFSSGGGFGGFGGGGFGGGGSSGRW